MKIIFKLVLLVDWLDISGQAYNRAPYVVNSSISQAGEVSQSFEAI